MKIKKYGLVFFVFLVFTNQNFGAVWSSLGTSGINKAYSSLSSFVGSKNQEIENYWNQTIGNLITQIEEENKKREQKLKELRALESELLLSEKELLFLIEQEKELLGKEVEVIGK